MKFLGEKLFWKKVFPRTPFQKTSILEKKKSDRVFFVIRGFLCYFFFFLRKCRTSRTTAVTITASTRRHASSSRTSPHGEPVTRIIVGPSAPPIMPIEASSENIFISSCLKRFLGGCGNPFSLKKGSRENFNHFPGCRSRTIWNASRAMSTVSAISSSVNAALMK